MSTQRQPSLLDHFRDRIEIALGSLSEPVKPTANVTNHTNKNTNSKEVDWVALCVELTLRLSLGLMTGYIMLWLTKKFMGPMLPEEDQTSSSAASIQARLHRILQKRSGGKQCIIPPLNSYERQMAEEILDPDEVESSFADIGGLDDTKREIYELAVLPLIQPELFSGTLVQPCKGILLYGRPGTGKTMLAKALAKEAEAVFLPLQLSKILNKWVGESNKLIAATFSLANKLQPAIIFIDELDNFLKANNSEAAYLDSIKAEFLTLWDGVATSTNSRVLVLGATNKPQQIDAAILRRMPRTFQVPLPDQEGRLAILRLLIKDEYVDDEVLPFMKELSSSTIGYSGSDLKELCKAAAMISIQEISAEFARRRVMGEKNVAQFQPKSRRPISKQDFVRALTKVRRTGAAAYSYGQEVATEEAQRESISKETIDLASLRNLTALIRSLSVLSTDGQNDDAMPTIS